jgi:N-acetylglucosamine-6-phosphate deacetylase
VNRLALQGRVIAGGRELTEATVVVEDGRVAEIRAGFGAVTGAETVGGSSWVVAPGFVDLQVNGFAGCDAMDGCEAIEAISAALPATGVTAFLPTMISRPIAEGCAFVDAARRARPAGARVLGAHIEGPFLSAQHVGAHDPAQLLEPRPELVDELLRRPPRMLTLAPELTGAPAAIARLSAAGVVVGLGHSAATDAQAHAGFDAGARFVTHLFNAMSALAHRRPGLPGAALVEPRATVGLIADGEHVHPDVLRLVLAAKGRRGVALTTDQTSAAGAQPGSHRLGGIEVLSDGRTVRRRDGTLAGSVATMDGMVRLLVGLGVPLRDVVEMAATVPARVIRARGVGRFRPGSRADVVLLDESLCPRLTLVGGRVRFRS